VTATTPAIDQQTAAATAAIELLGAGNLPRAQWALGLAQLPDGRRVVTAEGHLTAGGEDLRRWAGVLHDVTWDTAGATPRISGTFGRVPVTLVAA